MVAPTLTSITPDEGKPGGRYLLTIQGSDFELPPDPASSGYVGTGVPESMQVEIDGRLCTSVKVFTSSLLTCIAPAYRGEPDIVNVDPGLSVDVILRNLTGPEENAYADAFIYKRPDLTRGDGTLRYIVRTLLREMKRQIIENVALSHSVDYDEETGDQLDIVEQASIPGIALFGPSIAENKFRRGSIKPQNRNLSTLEFNKYDLPRVGDLEFRATLSGSSSGELLNLCQEFILFFRNNKTLEVIKDTSNPDLGYVGYEMFLMDDPSKVGNPNEHDIGEMEATFEVRGVPIDEDEWQIVDWGKILDDPADIEINSEQREQ